MRVLEPHHFKHRKAPRRRPSKQLFIKGLLVVGVVALGSYALFGQTIEFNRPSNKSSNQAEAAPVKPQPKILKQFTAEEFKTAYNSYLYPNTQPIEEPPVITGNEEADERIRRVAESRGYKLTALPVASIVKTEEPGLEGDDLIQPNAQVAWQKMKAAAKKADIKLKLTSAYRSIEYQRTLFLRRLQNAGVTVYTILDGYADDEVAGVLSRAAIPGYSRHHTGYAIDLSCNGIGLDAFKNTACYKWLSRNNFANAKKYGWVPSYPEGVGDQGPEPEPWEFVWIGTDRTYE